MIFPTMKKAGDGKPGESYRQRQPWFDDSEAIAKENTADSA